MLPAVPLLLAVAALSVALILLVRHRRTTPARQLARSIDTRSWPAAITGLDGRVLHANPAMRAACKLRRDLADMLEPQLGVTPATIYRVSRRALEAGFAQEVLGPQSGGRSGSLTVQISGDGNLIWQVMPGTGAEAMEADAGAGAFETAPFAYVRFNALHDPVTNQLFRDVFADKAATILREQIDDGVFAAGRVILPGADGNERLALTSVRIDRSVAGGCSEVFLFVPDRETSGQVAAAEILESIPVSLLHLDIEGRVFWGNAQARQMLGEAFRIGRMLGEIVQPLGRSLDSLLQDVRTGQDIGSGDMVRLQGENFDTFAQISLTHMLVQGQPSLMAVLTDASELRLLEDKFAQSQKMEAVGKLAGGVAHDFNNVLTAISGHCDLLLLRKDASHPDFSDLTQIRQNANRAASLVKQLLAFSRKQTLQPKLLSVQDVVTDTLYLLDRLIGETITLTLDHGRDSARSGPITSNSSRR